VAALTRAPGAALFFLIVELFPLAVGLRATPPLTTAALPLGLDMTIVGRQSACDEAAAKKTVKKNLEINR
jgi:hypothetical protein